jgi:regulatory protein
MQTNQTITEQEAYLRLAALCAQAEHCRHEMDEKMRRWGLDDEARERVLTRLVAERYIDEERYCRAFVADKISYNKWGRRKVEQALWMKHIDAAISQQVLDDVDDREYVAVLKPLIAQKRRSTKARSDYELNMKLIQFARSRGFGFDIIKQCMDVDDEELLGDDDD